MTAAIGCAITADARTAGIVETGDTGARVDGMMVFGVGDVAETAVVRIDGLNATIGLVEEGMGPMFRLG